MPAYSGIYVYLRFCILGSCPISFYSLLVRTREINCVIIIIYIYQYNNDQQKESKQF